MLTRTAIVHARCAWAMAVHHAVGISRQRNSGYRPSRLNIMARSLQGLSRFKVSPLWIHNPTHLSIRRCCATATLYTLHMVSRNTTLVPCLGLRIGPACEAGLSAGMRRQRVPPWIRKKERSYQSVRRINPCLSFLYGCMFKGRALA